MVRIRREVLHRSFDPMANLMLELLLVRPIGRVNQRSLRNEMSGCATDFIRIQGSVRSSGCVLERLQFRNASSQECTSHAYSPRGVGTENCSRKHATQSSCERVQNQHEDRRKMGSALCPDWSWQASRSRCRPLHSPRRLSPDLTDEDCKAVLVALLHRPPAEFGLDRTSWRLEDLHRMAAEHGAPIS